MKTDDERVQQLVDCVIQRLRIVREARGVSRYRVAKLTGLHASTISLVERGQRNPSLFVLIKIAAALEANLGSIVSECEAAPLESQQHEQEVENAEPDETREPVHARFEEILENSDFRSATGTDGAGSV